MKTLLIALFGVVLGSFSAGAASPFDRPAVKFYVSPKGNDKYDGSPKRPVATVPRALELARNVYSDSKREIVLADGVYRVAEPIKVTPLDYDVTVRAEHARKAVLSGAVALEGWVADTNDERFLTAKLPFKPVEGSVLIFTSSGERRHFSVYPSDDKNRNVRCPAPSGNSGNFKRLPYDPASFPEGFDIAQLDLASVWLLIQQEWAVNRTYVESVDAESHVFNLKTPTNMAIGMYNRGFKIMNSRLGMLQPGDWMYEASHDRIVYWPKEGEKAETLKCEVTCAGSIFDVRKAVNLTLSGLVLTGCSSTFSGGRGDHVYAAAVSGTVPRVLTVENCDIHTCAGHGIAIWKPYTTMIRENHIHHVGGDGIGFWDGGGADNEIRKNEVDHIGVLSLGLTGIYMQLAGIKCVGNKIHDIPGSGMVLWSEGALIAENDISDTMLTGRDGGGLYGAYDYTTVRDNYCHYTKPSDWPALYADEGSQHTVLTGNRVVGTWWPTHVHCAQYVEVKGNTFKFDGIKYGKGRPRFSFQGSAHCSFTDNRITYAGDIGGADDIVSCDKWADNTLYAPTPNGKYRKVKTLAFDIPKQPQYRGGQVFAPHARGAVDIDGNATGSEYPFNWRNTPWLNRLLDGRGYVGCPGHALKFSYDEANLYFHCEFRYSVLMPYSGSICKGHGWECADAIRLLFEGGRSVTLYADGSSEVEGGVQLANGGSTVAHFDWRHSGYELKIPLTSLGFEPNEDLTARAIAFNAVGRNCDHYESRYLFTPDGANLLTGKMGFLAPGAEGR